MFCTFADVEDFLQIEITAVDQTASVNRAITEVTEVIRNYCHQYLSHVADDDIILDNLFGEKQISLPELPVTEVTRVIEDDELLTPATDYILGQHGILYRLSGGRWCFWAQGIQNIEVRYSHGYQTIPDDIRGVATRSAARVFQAGLRAADTGGVMGVMNYSLGDFSVGFGSEHGGGVGEGSMGASSARALLMSEKDILNRYRIKRQ